MHDFVRHSLCELILFQSRSKERTQDIQETTETSNVPADPKSPEVHEKSHTVCLLGVHLRIYCLQNSSIREDVQLDKGAVNDWMTGRTAPHAHKVQVGIFCIAQRSYSRNLHRRASHYATD